MIKQLFLNDKFILVLILLNAVFIFFSGFQFSETVSFLLALSDNIITAMFIVEITVKISTYGFKGYLKSNWNKLDFILVLLSLPALLSFVLDIDLSSVSFLLVFRVLRVFKSFRFIRFVPGIEGLFSGVQRALKASVIVLLGFIIYIFIIGIFSYYLFKSSAPDYFSNPLQSLYSTFKIFTVEGWFEIPEQITTNYNPTKSFFTYLYFIFILLTGGIFGLSLVNSIFVDAMVSDNNDELEKKIDDLNEKVSKLLEKSKD